jgi:hypothetical protein
LLILKLDDRGSRNIQWQLHVGFNNQENENKYGTGTVPLLLFTNVVDRHRFHSDPDPNFYFHADPHAVLP